MEVSLKEITWSVSHPETLSSHSFPRAPGAEWVTGSGCRGVGAGERVPSGGQAAVGCRRGGARQGEGSCARVHVRVRRLAEIVGEGRGAGVRVGTVRL